MHSSYVIGATRSGKTNYLLSQIGGAFAFIDKHGQAAQQIADAMECVYWRPADLSYIVSLNPLQNVPPGWATPRFLTFKQALESGGNVRKGEHGTKVYFVKQLQVKDGEGEKADSRLIPMMREYTVFNVGQCDFLRSTGADIREGHGEAYYVPSHDFVSMHSRRSRAPITSITRRSTRSHAAIARRAYSTNWRLGLPSGLGLDAT
jgi:hypothetical protein